MPQAFRIAHKNWDNGALYDIGMIPLTHGTWYERSVINDFYTCGPHFVISGIFELVDYFFYQLNITFHYYLEGSFGTLAFWYMNHYWFHEAHFGVQLLIRIPRSANGSYLLPKVDDDATLWAWSLPSLGNCKENEEPFQSIDNMFTHWCGFSWAVRGWQAASLSWDFFIGSWMESE